VWKLLLEIFIRSQKGRQLSLQYKNKNQSVGTEKNTQICEERLLLVLRRETSSLTSEDE
jgi:hypothetical protein